MDYTFICSKRENCPKYTRYKCNGEYIDDVFIEEQIDGTVRKVAVTLSIDPLCIQEPWQKKLNGIKTAPPFVIQE